MMFEKLTKFKLSHALGNAFTDYIATMDSVMARYLAVVLLVKLLRRSCYCYQLHGQLIIASDDVSYRFPGLV